MIRLGFNPETIRPQILQIMAAVRCKQSKLRFFFGALYGKKWREDELFHPQALVQDRADQLLQRYKTSSQVRIAVTNSQSIDGNIIYRDMLQYQKSKSFDNDTKHRDVLQFQKDDSPHDDTICIV